MLAAVSAPLSSAQVSSAENSVSARRHRTRSPSGRPERDRRGLSGRVKRAVGGGVYVVGPGRVAEGGGDGTAATAMDAPALFGRLAAEAAEAEAAAQSGSSGGGAA